MAQVGGINATFDTSVIRYVTVDYFYGYYRATGTAILVRLFQTSSTATRRRHQQVFRLVHRWRDWTERHHYGSRILPDA